MDRSIPKPPPPARSIPESPEGAPEATCLAERILQGDLRAEEILVERYGPSVRRALAAQTRDRATADDLFQEVFTLALVKLRRGEIRAPGSLRAYFRGLARNLARYHYRRKAARRRRELPLAEQVSTLRGSADPLRGLLTGERRRLLRQALDDLPNERDREILRGFYLAGEGKESLCRRLAVGRGHFKRVLHRARRRCRRRLERRVGPAASRRH